MQNRPRSPGHTLHSHSKLPCCPDVSGAASVPAHCLCSDAGRLDPLQREGPEEAEAGDL